MKKRIFAIAMTAVMVFAFAACGNSKAPASVTVDPGPVPGLVTTNEGGPNANSDGTTNLENVAFFDPEFDYVAAAGGEPFKVKYLTGFSGPLYENNDVGYTHWAPLMGIQYDGMWSSQSDSDLFLQQLQATIDQGYDGILLDPDTTTYPAILDILNKNPQVQWMTLMSPARDLSVPEAPMVHPSVSFDQVDCGREMTRKSIELAGELWPDVPLEKIGVIEVDFSTVQALHERQVGAYEEWVELTGLADNFITLDGASGGMDADTARNLVQPILSTNTNYDRWLIMAAFDDYAPGCAAAVDSLGMADVANVTTIGGTALVTQWDAGGDMPGYRTSYHISATMEIEPVLGALYAFMAGYATPENIWPQWVNVNDHGLENQSYASMLVPLFWITKDNYQQYFAWSDVYTGANEYPNYSKDGITRETYSAIAPVPDRYHEKG
jgi:ABC-type sugar transport system substrate-binding protein